jgi:hypothetical protein
MNLAMAPLQAEQRMREVRRDVARCRDRAPGGPARNAARTYRWPGLRRRIGFTLLETGLRLLAQASHGSNGYPPEPRYRLP